MGYQKSNGGAFHDLDIFGSLSMNGDVLAEKIEIKGSATFKQEMETTLLHVIGNCKVYGGIKATDIRNKGVMKVNHGVYTTVLDNLGRAAMGSLQAIHVQSQGDLVVEKGVRAETFEVEGKLTIHEKAIVEKNIMISFTGQSVVGHLESQYISICRMKNGLQLILGRSLLRADTIIGEHIDLEHVEADFVKGHDVIIGPECRIRRVEYSGNLIIHPQAQVYKSSQVHI